MKNLVAFVMIVLWAFGVIGGFGATIYCKAYPCAVGMLAVAWMSWPVVKGYAKRLMSYHDKL